MTLRIVLVIVVAYALAAYAFRRAMRDAYIDDTGELCRDE